MASDALSQEEIDALLNAGARAQAAGAKPQAPSLPALQHQVYDFRRPHRISKDRLRTIEAMYERLAKSLEAWLLSRLRRPIELRLQSVEQYSFGEFTLSLPTPCASFSFDIRNAPGQRGVIDIGHELAFLVVDRFFGGDAQPVSLQRALTPIERLTVRVLIERVATLLREIWHDHVTLDLELTSFESFPEMVQAGNREDPVLVANIEVTGDGLRSLLIICLPFSVLEAFCAEGDSRRVSAMTGSSAERAMARQLTSASLRSVRVPAVVRLPPFQASLRDLMELTPGSVLATGLTIDTPAEMLIGGAPRFHVAPGRIGQRVAARITDPISDEHPSRATTPPVPFTPDQ
jgi:flagellar motor switch protein FliM